jgi:magnesium chelatase family protein
LARVIRWGRRATLARRLAKLHTFSLLGIDALPVVAEVDVSYAGRPKTVLVGLPEQAVKESIQRIEQAIVYSVFMLPSN